MPDDQPKPCTFSAPDGKHYDLSSLSATKDYAADAGLDGDAPKYMFNVCRGVLTELAGVDDPGKVGGFVEKPDGRGHFSLGQFSTNITLSPGTRDPMLVYEKGSPCPSNDQEFASTAIRFVCSPQDFGAGTPRLIASLPPGPDACHFFFEWKTHVACPTSPSANFNGGFVITFVSFILIALLTWFGGHTAYNRFYLGRRGMDQFPIRCGSCAAPKLRLPGAGNGASGSGSSRPRRWGFRRSQRTAGYNHLATEPDEEDSLAAARFSLTDDDDDVDHDARALGGEVDAWRGQRRSSSAEYEGRVAAHQGLVDL